MFVVSISATVSAFPEEIACGTWLLPARHAGDRLFRLTDGPDIISNRIMTGRRNIGILHSSRIFRQEDLATRGSVKIQHSGIGA